MDKFPETARIFLAKTLSPQRKAKLFVFLNPGFKDFLGGLCVFARDALRF
jgi:hypothetical protein